MPSPSLVLLCLGFQIFKQADIEHIRLHVGPQAATRKLDPSKNLPKLPGAGSWIIEIIIIKVNNNG
jgi:hypothetical protein